MRANCLPAVAGSADNGFKFICVEIKLLHAHNVCSAAVDVLHKVRITSLKTGMFADLQQR